MRTVKYMFKRPIFRLLDRPLLNFPDPILSHTVHFHSKYGDFQSIGPSTFQFDIVAMIHERSLKVAEAPLFIPIGLSILDRPLNSPRKKYIFQFTLLAHF